MANQPFKPFISVARTFKAERAACRPTCGHPGTTDLGSGIHLFSYDICGMDDANTTEIDPDTKYPVIDILPEQIEKMKKSDYGNTMRLGEWKAILKEGSIVSKLYGEKEVSERHRHRYEVNPEFISKIEKEGLVFSGHSPDKTLMEFIELPKHKFFVATQGHPEFKSRLDNPSPMFYEFVRAASD